MAVAVGVSVTIDLSGDRTISARRGRAGRWSFGASQGGLAAGQLGEVEQVLAIGFVQGAPGDGVGELADGVDGGEGAQDAVEGGLGKGEAVVVGVMGMPAVVADAEGEELVAGQPSGG